MVKRFHRKTGAYHGMIYFKRPLISVKTKKISSVGADFI